MGVTSAPKGFGSHAIGWMATVHDVRYITKWKGLLRSRSMHSFLDKEVFSTVSNLSETFAVFISVENSDT